MKTRIVILMALAFALAGCVHKVYVPYPVCPKNIPPAPSLLNTDQVRPTDPVDLILKAYVADIVTLKGDLAACLVVLKAYDRVPDKLPEPVK